MRNVCLDTQQYEISPGDEPLGLLFFFSTQMMVYRYMMRLVGATKTSRHNNDFTAPWLQVLLL